MLCPACGSKKLGKKGHARGKQRWHCKVETCGWHGTEPVGIDNVGIDQKVAARIHARITAGKGVRRYVITAAQNATPVWQPFFRSLLQYCRRNRAQLVVIPYRYKNPTSMWTDKAKDDDWWAKEVRPYMMNWRTELDRHLVLLADIKTQPTASAPLQGFETLTGSQSAIIGHPKLELATIPTPQARLPKILTTTGAVTEKNYIPSKAGKKAEHHHTNGACVVELADGLFHLRQINAAHDGSFHDLDRRYTPTGSHESFISGLVMGDTHVEFVDPQVVVATFGEGGIVPALKPRQLVWHDVLDFYARSHWHRGKVFTNFAKHHAHLGNVEAAVSACYDFIDKHSPPGTKNVIVSSNHHNHFARWIEESDWRSDPENAAFYLRTALAMAEHTRMGRSGAETIDPFAYWGKQRLKCADRTRFITEADGHQIEGIEVGYHGHDGPNGARGNIRSFGKIGAKTVIGHSHTPGIKDGVYQVGTSSQLRLEFVKGPSSWLHTHCLIYPNGKRTLINIVDGRWRA